MLRGLPEIDAALIPHLYDLPPQHSALAAMRAPPGDLVVLSWLYERATRWVLHAQGIRGRNGVSPAESAGEEMPPGETAAPANFRSEALNAILPARNIYCLDLRSHSQAEPFLHEIQRILRAPRDVPLTRRQEAVAPLTGESPLHGQWIVREERGTVERRWYPVIDYSRCTHCMECIDFCLFGVYGIDDAESILVEQPDQCRKGCPACSRVCPESAIIFPLHKTPAIAGAPGDVAPLKVDLSQLFGGPEPPRDARQIAMAEREQHLEPKPPPTEPSPRPDDLDQLLDALDEFE